MKKMKFRMIKAAFLISAGVALVGCDDREGDPEEQIEKLESKVRDLEEKIDEIDSGFRGVTGSVLKLGREVEDFSSENWRTNVPDVEYQFEQLKLAVSEVEKKF